MKISRRFTTSGGVLVTTLIVCVLIGLMLAAYLSMLSNQHKMSQRSQVWNNCIPMAEAGVEEALAHMNHRDTTSNFNVNGWSALSGGLYRKSRPLNGGTISMGISNDNPPTVWVRASLDAPVQSGSLTRSIRVKTKLNQPFPNGILSKGSVVLGGSGRIDSFNSTNVLESDPFGQYNPATATDRATVVTTATNSGAINVGNMSIYGSVATGPGGTAVVSPGGNVGSTVFNNDPAYDGQIEAGHSTDDVNVYIPDAAMPIPWGPASTPGPGIVNGTSYQWVVTEGDWELPTGITIDGTKKMLITGKARVWSRANTSVSGQGSITIDTNSAVQWYATGSVSISGGGVVNVPGLAKNFAIIGLNSCTSVSYSGTSRFIGTVYAPHATVKFSGTSDAYGAIVGKSVELSGGMGLHYDESLKGDPRKARFVAASWQEL